METTATQTQEKETSAEYATVIPPALALIYLPPSTTCCAPTSYFIHLPMKMELVEGSETSAIRTQTPGNYPKENILHIEHSESLKSRNKYI